MLLAYSRKFNIGKVARYHRLVMKEEGEICFA
jgi:hypothetical protein